jgi:hypothetical protein
VPPVAGAVVLTERGCTAAAGAVVAVVGDYPRTAAEGGAAVPRVGCRSCGRLCGLSYKD